MDKQWYVVNTYSGHENKVKEKLEMRAESMDMQDYIYRVVIPEEKVVEVKDGVTKEKVKKMFPGYILVEMVMTDEAWYVVRNTPLPLDPMNPVTPGVFLTTYHASSVIYISINKYPGYVFFIFILSVGKPSFKTGTGCSATITLKM